MARRAHERKGSIALQGLLGGADGTTWEISCKLAGNGSMNSYPSEIKSRAGRTTLSGLSTGFVAYLSSSFLLYIIFTFFASLSGI
jgi:hypothetical protein